jgi:hypothetical protein
MSTRRRSSAPSAPWGLLFASLILGLLGQALLWTWERPTASGFRILAGWALMAVGGLLLLKAWRRLQALGDLGFSDKAWPVWGEATAVLLLVVFALFMRTVKLDTYPNAGFRDEGEAGNVAVSIMNGEPVTNTGTSTPVYIEEVYQNPAGYFYPAALSLKLFGVSMKSVRLTGVMWGVLSVAFFYFLARSMMGLPMALFLSLILCGLRWHLNFSRVALIAMHTLSLELPAMYFLWRGVNEDDSGNLKRYPYGALIFSLLIALASYFFPLAELGGAGSTVSWLGWLLRFILHLPLLWCAWQARGDKRSLWFFAAGAALGFCLYSYLASRLVLISCVMLWSGFFFREQGGLAGRRGWALLIALVSAVAGVLVLAQASEWAGPQAAAGVKAVAPLLKLLGLLLLLGGILWIHVLKLMALRQPGTLSRWLRPLLLAVAGCWFIAAPLNNYMVRNYSQMFSRTQRVWVWGNEDYDDRPWGGKLLQSVKHTLGMINVQGDGNPRHNDPGRPMFNPLLATFFGLGAFFLLLRLSAPLPLFLFLWLQCHWLAGYMGIEAPQAFRSLGSLPAVLLIAGQAFLPWVYALRAELRKGWRAYAFFFLAVIASGVVLWDSYDYFVNQPKHPGVWSEFSAGEYNMAKDLKALQPGTRGLLRADWSDSWTVRFVTYPERNYEPFDVVKHVPMDPKLAIPGSDYLYVLDTAYLPLVGLLKDYYPNGVYKELHHPLNNELIYWSYLVKAQDIANAKARGTGLSARYFKDKDDGTHWVASTQMIKRVDPFILFNWTVSPVSGHFSAEWTGSLKAPKSGSYGFHAFSNNIASLSIDGHSVFDRKDELGGDRWSDGKLTLSAGRHSLRVRYAESRNYSRMELWWTVPGQAKAVVPGAALLP